MFHISKKDEYNIMINCEINLKEASKIRSVINTEEDGGGGLDLNDGDTRRIDFGKIDGESSCVQEQSRTDIVPIKLFQLQRGYCFGVPS